MYLLDDVEVHREYIKRKNYRDTANKSSSLNIYLYVFCCLRVSTVENKSMKHICIEIYINFRSTQKLKNPYRA